MFSAQSRTPLEVSSAINRLCWELVADPKPTFVDNTPTDGAEVNDCFNVVRRHVRDEGGSICYGWEIWEWPGLMIEAEFHAVWQDESGDLHDLTPKPLSTERILFLADPKRTYEGRQVNNVRRALTEHADVRSFIEATEAEFEFLNRGARAEQQEIRMTRTEADELAAIQRQKASAYLRIVSSRTTPGRNDPCTCGSGRKYKKCHGR